MKNERKLAKYACYGWKAAITIVLVLALVMCHFLRNGVAEVKAQSRCSMAEVTNENQDILEISFWDNAGKTAYQVVRCTAQEPHRLLSRDCYNSDGTFQKSEVPSEQEAVSYDWVQAERPEEVQWKSSEGGTVRREEYEYSAMGKPLQCKIACEDGTQQQQSWNYDEEGRLLRRETTESGYKLCETQYEYDPDTGRLIRSVYSARDERREQEYNEAGQAILTKEYSSDGILHSVYQCSYSPAGRISSWSCYDAQGGIKKTAIYEYSDRNRMTRSTLYDAQDNSVTITEYQVFRGAECAVKIEHYTQGTLDSVCSNEYDANGVLHSSIMRGPN